MKILKIRDGFFELFDRCQAVNESTDYKEKIKIRREFYEYTYKHRKVLRVSQEQIEQMEANLIALEKSDVEVDRAEAKLAKARRAAAQAKEKYYQALLEQPPTGKERLKH